MTSYDVLEKLQKILPAEAHGIRMRTANFFFDRPIEENEEEYNKMREIEAAKVRHAAVIWFADCSTDSISICAN